jgi:hypothetical protein
VHNHFYHTPQRTDPMYFGNNRRITCPLRMNICATMRYQSGA